MKIQQTFDSALRHHQAGRLADAERLYRQIIADEPRHGDALHLLGVTAHQGGRNKEAVEFVRRALAVKPNTPEYHLSLGIALDGLKEHAQAVAALKQAIALRSNYPKALNNLGNVLLAMEQADAAIEQYQRALQLEPDNAEAMFNLGNALGTVKRFDVALPYCRRATKLFPNRADAWMNLASAAYDLRDFDTAIAACRRALELDPSRGIVHGKLANSLRAVGLLDESIECYARSGADPTLQPASDSNWIYGLYFHPEYSAEAILKAHLDWNERYARPLRKHILPHRNRPDPERRLRIGYVSADFCDHVVAWNFLPLLANRDKSQFEVFCYANVKTPDEWTKKLAAQADAWRDISLVSDQDAAAAVRADEIDILVDLSLHSSGNRLLLFARKPAPVQATYLAYPGTSGVETIDYRISDPHLDPPGGELNGESRAHSEETVLLPDTYWCYQPGGPTPAVQEPPSVAKGYITFGCMNNFTKVTNPTLDLWARIFAAVPGSRLILNCPAGSARERVCRRLNISADRLEGVQIQDWPDYIQVYHRIDIGLDPFPYAGGITTCDTLWMGAPVVTLSGATSVGRGGRSILSNVGLGEYVAKTPGEYERLALKLASEPRTLAGLRAGLRQRMVDSPLTNARLFARNIEAAYRQMWRRWVEKKRGASD